MAAKQPEKDERVDKWLWVMRVFKTRTIATDECKKGRVTIGPDPATAVLAKPSRAVKVGDIIHVRKPPIQYSFRILQLANNRLGARLVPEYLENITPKEQYDLLDVVRISGFVDRRKGLGRPTKREGRELSRFREQAFENDDFFLDWDDGDGDD